jgi:hypothetical protein
VKEYADYEKNMKKITQLYHQLISNNHVRNRGDIIPKIRNHSSGGTRGYDQNPGASRPR